MARAIFKLTDRKVAALKLPGRHADGGGLYLRITPQGARSWVFMSAVGGKRTEIGLGSASSISLKSVRALASQMREAVTVGNDPRALLKSAAVPEPARVVTFGDFAGAYIARVQAHWKSEVHKKQWKSTMRDHAAPLLAMPIDAVATEDVLKVLTPIWHEKPETAGRVRGRIEKILSAAAAEGLIDTPYANPARWAGHLEHALGKRTRLSRGHHAALDYQAGPAFMIELSKRAALSARCLEFVILTGARSGEALAAVWGEIDLGNAVWTVPAVRMKGGREHRVPLSRPAVALLEALRSDNAAPGDRVFAVAGAVRSNMAMAMLLRRMGRGDVTTHGFRSTFRDWAGDETGHAHHVIEAALAHALRDKVEAAYRRKDAFEKRRVLMDDWARFLVGPELDDPLPANQEPATSTQPPR